MSKKNDFFIYTCMWIAAVVVLMALLMQNMGDARIVNYSGIVRGATQKLVKEEMNGQQDDELIMRLDGIIENLQTGHGEFKLRKNSDWEYQQRLNHLDSIWKQIKDEIYEVRHGNESPERLYNLSEEHFNEADKMVLRAEQSSENKLVRFIVIYGAVLVLSVCIFNVFNDKSHKALEISIYTDNLTGMLNKAGFEARAANLLRQHPENEYALLEFDIDDFKFLNNSYGFELGDKMLCALAAGLTEIYHTDQLCARISADDFVILVKQEQEMINDLRAVLSETIHQESLTNVSEFVTFTVGGYEIPENGEAIQSVLDKANMAHKEAKMLGKSMTVWYNEKLLEKLKSENSLKNRMKKALEHGEFEMYLQPKVRLADMKMHSAEALVRWNIPEYGIVAPDDFIPLFERNGSIADIDFHMLEKACEFVRYYIDTHGKEFLVSVNFSRVTLYQQRFYPTVMELVERFKIPHHCIEMEITESAFNGISEVMIHKITLLQEEGFIISMDDFGSGYSSLNLLDTLPIQVLKLDREFLREYGVTEKARKVISCVVELAHTLDIHVVCEGIERLEHVELLREIGCDYGQGFYFSRPVPQAEFMRNADELMYQEKL